MANLRLLLLILLGLILIPVKGPDTTVTFIDVGQGDGIYLDAGEDILIDGGSSSTKKIGKYTLEPFLKSKRIGSIEKLFVSHADADHTNGLSYLGESSGITIDDLYLPACAEGDESYAALIDALSGKRKENGRPRIHYIKAGDIIPVEHGRITCMSPADVEAPSDMNDQSLILLYEENDFSALFTGDASKDCEIEMLGAIDSGKLPRINCLTLLKAGHHGSKTSTSKELLDASTPLIAVLSYGEDNRYGHPHTETTELLGRYHVRTYHTALSGAITLTTDGHNSIHISQFCSGN